MKKFTLIFFVLFCTKCHAQFDLVPKVGVSPEVAMLHKYQQAEISPYTGIPDISIPLYTATVDKIQIPITLRYHSSGIHIAEDATWVGLGWDLAVGGNITQILNGESDQSDFLSKNDYLKLINGVGSGFNSFSGRQLHCFSWQCYTPCYDNDFQKDDEFAGKNSLTFGLGKPDNYSYFLPGQSGKFYIDPITKNPIICGKKNEQITINYTHNNNEDKWNISDMDGIHYLFNTSDKEYSNIHPFPNQQSFNGLSSNTWWLSTISLPSGKQVSFTYTNDNSHTCTHSQKYMRQHLLNPDAGNNCQVITDLSQVNNYSKKLTTIETDKERIVFELSTTRDERVDIKEADSGSIPKRLNAIHIWDKINNKKIKSFKLYYSYFTSNLLTNDLISDGKRLKLDSIQEIGYTDSGIEVKQIPPYKFEYNTTNPLPSKNSNAVDFWGYYNGQTSNKGLLPTLCENLLFNFKETTNYPTEVVDDFQNIGNANRGMDPTYATSGLITKITYPTGGYLKLNYEANEFSNYSIPSATDINQINAINPYKTISVMNYCSTTAPVKSDFIYPQKNGTLTLIDFKCGIDMINDINIDNYKDSYIKLYKVDIAGATTLIQTWSLANLQQQYYYNNSNKIYTNQYLYKNDKIQYNYDPTDKYYFECHVSSKFTCGGNPGSSGGTISANCVVFDPTVKIPVCRSIGGGVRIASQETYNSTNRLALKRKYNYTNEDGSTSGKLMSPIRFHTLRYYTNKGENYSGVFPNAYIFTYSSSSYSPIAYDANGAVVGYSRVEILDTDSLNSNTGKTVYYYRNTPSTPGYTEVGLPNLPYEDNGLEDSIKIINRQNELVKKVYNNYDTIQSSICYGINVIDGYIGPDYCISNEVGSVNPWAYEGRWSINYYPIQTRWYKLINTTDYTYLQGSNSPIVSSKKFVYNSIGQTINTIVNTSDGNTLKTSYLFPIDDKTGINPLSSQMISKNLYNNLLQEVVTKNNDTNWLKLNKLDYQTTSTGNIKTSALNQAFAGGTSYQPISEILYDKADNVQQYRQNEIYTTLLWSYNDNYPVAKIEGISYSDLTNNYYSQSLIDQLAQTALPTQSQINDIRTALAKVNAKVTTYTYAPLIGILTATDPKGVKTAYTYDTSGRLKNVKNHEENLLSKYLYHYHNR